MADIQNLRDSYIGLERILYAIQQHEVPTNILTLFGVKGGWPSVL